MILSKNMVSQPIWIGIFIGLFFVGLVSLQPSVFGDHVIVEGEKRAMEGILKTERETMVSEMQEESENLDGGGCLIATATFGSELASQVQQLRELRDNTLLRSKSGSAFMIGFNQFYYLFSPTVADWERKNPAFKEAVKVTITPLLTTLSILNYVDIDSEAEMLGYGIGIILLNIGMYFLVPTILIVKLRERFSR